MRASTGRPAAIAGVIATPAIAVPARCVGSTEPTRSPDARSKEDIMSKLTQAINPPTLVKPAGYSHAWETQGGKTVYIAGQVAVDREGRVVGAGDLVAQFRQVCENLKAVLVSRAGQMNDIVKLTIYVLSKSDYKARTREIGAVYRDYFGATTRP